MMLSWLGLLCTFSAIDAHDGSKNITLEDITGDHITIHMLSYNDIPNLGLNS